MTCLSSHSILNAPPVHAASMPQPCNSTLKKLFSGFFTGYEFLKSVPSLITRAHVRCSSETKSKKDSHTDIVEKQGTAKSQPLTSVAVVMSANYAIGMIANYTTTNSVLEKMPVNCATFGDTPLIGAVNDWRQQIYDCRIYNYLPLQMIPPTIVAIENGFRNEDNEQRTVGHVLQKITNNLFKVTLRPLLIHLGAMASDKILRRYLNRITVKLDASGHAAFYVIYFNLLSNVSKALFPIATPFQIKLLAGGLTALTIFELPWVYNTASACHSIADVIVGAVSGATLSTLSEKCISLLLP